MRREDETSIIFIVVEVELRMHRVLPLLPSYDDRIYDELPNDPDEPINISSLLLRDKIIPVDIQHCNRRYSNSNDIWPQTRTANTIASSCMQTDHACASPVA